MIKFKNITHELESFFVLCHYVGLGVFPTWLAGQFGWWSIWPAIIAAIAWELIVDCWWHTIISDNEGFSVGDVIWAAIGGIVVLAANGKLW